jgi:hypothetical protein
VNFSQTFIIAIIIIICITVKILTTHYINNSKAQSLYVGSYSDDFGMFITVKTKQHYILSHVNPVCIFTFHLNNIFSGTALDYGLDGRGFESRQGLGIFLFTTASRPVLRPTQPPIQWVPGAISLGVKRPGHEADHSHPSNAEVNNAWSYTSTPQYKLIKWCSVKAQGQLTFTLPPIYTLVLSRGIYCYFNFV